MVKKRTANKQQVKHELTELEKFYIEQKCRDGVSLDEIKQQKISPISLVEQLYNQTVTEIQEENKVTAGKLFSRNENYGAVVMTPQSSEFADSKRPTSESQKIEKKESHIHKFRQ